MSSSKRPDFVERGVKQPSPKSRAFYTILRILVPFATYILLATPTLPNLLTSFGLRSIETSTRLIDVEQAFPNLANQLQHPPTRLAAIGLSLPRVLLLAGSIAAAAKQLYWGLFIQKETLSVYNAIYVPLVNAVPELLQSILYFTRTTSIAPASGEAVVAPIVFGTAMFAIGIATEWYSEYQRDLFKNDSRNKGKVYKGGLFALARHINFTGFIAWKSAGFYMSAGWLIGGFTTLFFVLFFDLQAIPPLDQYCQERYKEQWTRYKEAVPNRLVPRF